MGMIKIDVYRHYWRVDKPSLLITLIVWAVCVFVDPTYAIVVAILFGLLRSACAHGSRARSPPAYLSALDSIRASSHRLATTPPLPRPHPTTPPPACHQLATWLATTRRRNEGDVAPARWRTAKLAGTEVQIYQPAGKWDYTNLVTHRERVSEAKKHGGVVVVAMCDVFLVDVDAIDALKALAAAKTPIVGLQEAPAAACAKHAWFAQATADGVVLESLDALDARGFAAAAEEMDETAPEEDGHADEYLADDEHRPLSPKKPQASPSKSPRPQRFSPCEVAIRIDEQEAYPVATL